MVLSCYLRQWVTYMVSWSVCAVHRVTCTAEAHGALHDRAAAANSTSSRLEFESCMPCKTLQMPAALSRRSRLPSSPRELCVPSSDGYSRLETSASVRGYDKRCAQCWNNLCMGACVAYWDNKLGHVKIVESTAHGSSHHALSCTPTAAQCNLCCCFKISKLPKLAAAIAETLGVKTLLSLLR